MGLFKGLVNEFKDFAMRGNVIDLAVGVVIGSAFGKIVSSLVSNIVMPPINLLTSRFGVNFANMAWTIHTEAPKLDAKTGEIIKKADGTPDMIIQDYPIMKYGPFIETVVDFLLISAAIFLFVKAINAAKTKFEKAKADEPPPPTPEEVVLLREIRDALAKR